MSVAPRLYAWVCAPLLLGVLGMGGAHYYYQVSWGDGCARCHEIRDNFDRWHASTHRKINCTECHDSSMRSNVRRVVTHLKGEAPEHIQLASEDVPRMVEKCKGCHRQEFAQWQAGPHSTTYARLFTDREHNQKRLLTDDCLRCHGMHFGGAMKDLVEPLDTKGPWHLKDAALANRPAIPCLSCHVMHREGAPLLKGDRIVGAKQEIQRPSVGLFDRRARVNLKSSVLPLPVMFEKSRAVKISPDQRQATCYQCHAPQSAAEVGSGDDRTPVGVHEGLSCLACHQKHGQDTRASCADCHPRLSNCGINVEKMDTTFMDPKSKHNVHWVKCVDCHPKGVPKKKSPAGAVGTE